MSTVESITDAVIAETESLAEAADDETVLLAAILTALEA